MKSVGIREGKAHLSELVRAAAEGEPTIITDYGKPSAVIVAFKDGGGGHEVGFSDPAKFKDALLALPHGIELSF